MERGRQEERDDGGQRGGGGRMGEGGGVKLREARERSKNRRDLQRKRERRAGGKGPRVGGEEGRGRRGQERKGVMNEGRAARWRDESGGMEGWSEREDEKERKRECEAAVYLPNKLDRISSIIKEERETAKTRRHT